jgi:CPA2 family monovalent cation:H+ antiporter-2
VLRAAGLERAQAAVITLDQPGLAERAVAVLRGHASQFPIVARARDGAHRRRLENAGASAVVSEAVEASLQLGAEVLRLSGTPAEQLDEILAHFRRDDYALLDSLDEAAPAEGPRGRMGLGSRLARRIRPARRRGRSGEAGE